VGLWLVAVGAGFAFLLRYKSQPVLSDGRPPASWPATSLLARPEGRFSLLLFAHPRCACTQASISELARLMPALSDRVAAQVLVVRPPGVSDDWEDTELWRRAAAIPGVAVSRDQDGAEASGFRVAVSGTTLLYDAGGRLQFSGGITPSRGHEGDSFGRRRILDILNHGKADRTDAPVFGCYLAGEMSVHLSNEEGS
jgi:hypothetical protein